MSEYDVYIVNAINNDSALAEAKTKLSQRFNLSPEKADALLRQRKVAIKRQVSEAVADKLLSAIRSCGLDGEKVSLVPVDSGLDLSLEPIDEPAPITTDASRLQEQESTPTPQPANNDHPSAEPDDDSSIYRAPTANVSKDLFCRQCGARMAASAATCPSCGAAAPIQEGGPSKVAAGFLAFFLGGFGIHRFYLRQWWGVFYIPFGLFGIIFPVTLVESIYFWAMSKEKWQAKYGHLPPSSAAVIVAICIVPFIAVIGILAAVALPAYQDYTHRAKVSEGLIELRSKAREFESIAIQNDAIPTSFEEAGVSQTVSSQHLQSIQLNEAGELVGTFAPLSTTSPAMTIVLTPSYERDGTSIIGASWACNGGTMPDKFRPQDCRGGSDVLSPEKAVSGITTLRSIESSATLQVPGSWKEGVAENSDASINAGNIYREAYVILIEEQDEDANFGGLIDYAPTLEDYYASVFNDYQLISREDVTSEEGRPGKILKFNAYEEGHNITYKLALFQDRDRYYQVFAWSLSNRFAQNEAAFDEVIRSFHP